MRDILNSYSVTELRKFISSSNIKGYGKMKKKEIVDLMVKKENVDKFKHIKMKPKKERKAPKKKEPKKEAPKKEAPKKEAPKNPYKELDEYIKNEVPKFTNWNKLEDALRNKIETLFLNKNLPDTIMPFRDRLKKGNYSRELISRIRQNLNKTLRKDRDFDADRLFNHIITFKFKLKGETGRTLANIKEYWKKQPEEVKKNTKEIIEMYNNKNLKTVTVKSVIKKMNGQYLPYKITDNYFYYSKEKRSEANRGHALDKYIQDNSKIKKLPRTQLEDYYYANLENIIPRTD